MAVSQSIFEKITDFRTFAYLKLKKGVVNKLLAYLPFLSLPSAIPSGTLNFYKAVSFVLTLKTTRI